MIKNVIFVWKMDENDNPVFDLSNENEPRIVAAQTPVNPIGELLESCLANGKRQYS